MNQIEKSILNQMWIYTAALRTLRFLNLYSKYPKQVDLTIENLKISAQMLLIETKRQAEELKRQYMLR